MINIRQRISLSRSSKRKINDFKKSVSGKFDENSWSSIPKSVKNEISKRLLAVQYLYCVYCEGSLINQGNQIDHFSPKSHTPEFSFTTTNLFYSCDLCNAMNRKGDKPTMKNPVLPKYYQNDFKIVHPYFDNTDAEIVFTDADRIQFDWERCGIRGIYTIWFFKWCDLRMTMVRSMNATLKRYGTKITPSDRDLINEIIAYK